MIHILLFYLSRFITACNFGENITITKNTDKSGFDWFANFLDYDNVKKDSKVTMNLKFYFKEKKKGWWIFNDTNQNLDITTIPNPSRHNNGKFRFKKSHLEQIKKFKDMFVNPSKHYPITNYGLIIVADVVPNCLARNSITYYIDDNNDGIKDREIQKQTDCDPLTYESQPFWID